MATDPAQRPPTIDATAAARWSRLAPADGSPWLHEEIGRRMEDRLQWIKAQPRTWADWSPLRGGLEAHALVARRYRRGRCLRDRARARLAAATGRGAERALVERAALAGRQARFDAPPEDGVDLLWANMALHMAADPRGADRALAPAGGDRRLPDVLLPRARHAARAARAACRASAGRRPATSSPTCTTGATCWCTPASPSR